MDRCAIYEWKDAVMDHWIDAINGLVGICNYRISGYMSIMNEWKDANNGVITG